MSMPSSSDEVATSARKRAGLQQILDLDALRPRDRPVMRAHQRLAGQLVERAGQPLGQPPAVDEDQRRAMRADQLEQPRVDRRPDRRPRVAHRRPARSGSSSGLGQLRHVLDRHLDRERERLPLAGVDDRDRPVADDSRDAENSCSISRIGRRLTIADCAIRGLADVAVADACGRRFGAAEEPRDFVERPLRRRQPDPLRRTLAVRLQPLERQRQVRAALGRHQRVNLVDDDRVDRAQRLARVRRQQQIERLRRRDQNVGRLALKAGALGLRRVAGADRDRRREVRRRRGRRRPGRCRPAAPAGCARRRPRAP